MRARSKSRLTKFLYTLNLVGLVLIIYLVATGLKLHNYMSEGNKLAKSTVPFNRKEGDRSFLILGDSLAYGVGASSPEKSLAGQIAQHAPDAQIVNKSVIGHDIEELAKSSSIFIDHKYNAIFIFIGGNDIARSGIKLEESVAHLKVIYEKASESADKVYVFSTIRFDQVSAIPEVLQRTYEKRSYYLYSHSRSLSARNDKFKFVDAYHIPAEEYKGYQAADGFHLNDAGSKKLIDLAFAMGAF